MNQGQICERNSRILKRNMRYVIMASIVFVLIETQARKHKKKTRENGKDKETVLDDTKLVVSRHLTNWGYTSDSLVDHLYTVCRQCMGPLWRVCTYEWCSIGWGRGVDRRPRVHPVPLDPHNDICVLWILDCTKRVSLTWGIPHLLRLGNPIVVVRT